MACTSDITTGRTRVCKDSLGGAKKIYFFNYVEDPFTVVANEATAINPLLTEVFEFEIEGDGNTLLQNFIGERQNGTSVNTQTLTTIFKKQDSDSSANLSFLDCESIIFEPLKNLINIFLYSQAIFRLDFLLKLLEIIFSR